MIGDAPHGTAADRLAAVYCCPVCADGFAARSGALVCPRGHAFDLAREGYVNLLLSSDKRSRDPGYSREMIAARADFFATGHYDRLADGLAALCRPTSATGVTLDVGCGEGFYLRRLRRALGTAGVPGSAGEGGALLAGVDVSKHGVRAAARADRLGAFAVGNAYRLPVADGSVGTAIVHFSPVDADELARVLAPDGVLVIGEPGARHLDSIKELLYAEPTPHREADPLAGDVRFDPVDRTEVAYPVELGSPTEIARLIDMTPYAHSFSRRHGDPLAGRTRLVTDVDVVFRRFRRTAAA